MLDKPKPVVDDLQRLIDKEAIRNNMMRYCRAVDRRDYDLLRTVYHADAYDDHGSYKGDVDGLIEWIERRHVSIEQSMHMVCNDTIDFLADDAAVMESYVVVPQRYPAEAKETIRAWAGDVEVRPTQRLRVIMYARMIDRVEKRHGEWRIANRVVVIEEVYHELVEVKDGPPISVEQIRGPGDALYKMLAG